MKRGVATSESAQRELRSHEELAKQQARADLVSVLSTAPGRRVLWELITNVAGTHGSSFNPHGSQASFNEGRRHVGLRLEAACKAASRRLYLTMVSEALEAEDEQQKTQAEASAIADRDD